MRRDADADLMRFAATGLATSRTRRQPLYITEIEGKPYVRSTNFAKVFEREHKSVLDSIRNRQISASFLPISYQDSRKREQQEFLISHDAIFVLKDYSIFLPQIR